MSLRVVGGLWSADSLKTKYLQGNLTKEVKIGQKIFIFKNKKKKTKAHPDYSICIREDD